MYMKPTLPCQPFLVVSSINLLSRPEQGWERNATVGRCRSGRVAAVKTKKKTFNSIHLISAGYLEKVEVRGFRMWEQNSSGRGGWAVWKRKEARLDGGHPLLLALPSLPAPLATAADTCLNTYTSSTPQFCLKRTFLSSPSPVWLLPQGEILTEVGGGNEHKSSF